MGLIVIEKGGKKKNKPGKYINNSFAQPENEVNQELYPEEQVVFTVPSNKVHNEEIVDMPREVEQNNNEPVVVSIPNQVINQEKIEQKVDEIELPREAVNNENNNLEDREDVDSYKNVVSNDAVYQESFQSASSDEKIEFVDDGVEDGVIKNEGSLVNIAFFTILESYLAFFIAIVALLVISYLVVRACGVKYTLFPSRAIYSVENYNHDIKISMLIFAISTFVSGIVAMICLNVATRRRFKRYYLEPLMVYLYDAFLVFINLFLYVIICLIVFKLIDNLYLSLQIINSNGLIEGPVNLEAIIHFKMFVVIIDSILLALSGYFCVDINHQKNKYVFLESHF